MTKNRNCFVVKLVGFSHGTNWVVVILLLLSPYAAAQTEIAQPPPPSPVVYFTDPKIKVSPSMAIVLVCLISAFFAMGCVSVYVRQCAQRRMAHAFSPSPHGSCQYRRRGLDPTVIETFPTFLYSDVKGCKIGKAALECAVCLNEFEDDEMLRLLPKCCHVFHPDCIDCWLAAHVTCPVCRANLVPKPGELSQFTILTHDSDSESPDSVIPHDSVCVAYDMIINIESPEVINPSQTLVQNRPPRSTPRKMKSRGNFRSNSTGHSLVQPGDNCERFTLRLPEEVRKRLVVPGLSRTKSCIAFPRERSTRKGYRSSSVGTGRGRRNYMHYERFDREGWSDRWGFNMTPNRSPSVVSGNEVTATPKKSLRHFKKPFNRLFGGTEKDNVGECSSDRLRTDSQV